MQRTVAPHSKKPKPEIHFIRSVAAPKKNPESSDRLPLSDLQNETLFAISLTVNLHDKCPQSFTFSHNANTKVSALISFIKQKIEMENVYFVSGDFLVDYFLTLPNRLVSELNTKKLSLNAQTIKVDD